MRDWFSYWFTLLLHPKERCQALACAEVIGQTHGWARLGAGAPLEAKDAALAVECARLTSFLDHGEL